MSNLWQICVSKRRRRMRISHRFFSVFSSRWSYFFVCYIRSINLIQESGTSSHITPPHLVYVEGKKKSRWRAWNDGFLISSLTSSLVVVINDDRLRFQVEKKKKNLIKPKQSIWSKMRKKSLFFVGSLCFVWFSQPINTSPVKSINHHNRQPNFHASSELNLFSHYKHNNCTNI
jgi:hypothetical protein